MVKKQLFLAALFHSEIGTLSPIISLKHSELLDLAGIEGLCIDGLDKLGYDLHDDTGKLCYLEDATYRV